MNKTLTNNNQISLPRIKLIKPLTKRKQTLEEQSQSQQINYLDQWTSEKSQQRTRKSKLIKAMYRESIGRKNTKRLYSQSSEIVDAKLFLMRLDGELKKAQDINYEAIHKNIQFCSGIFENLYGSLLRQIDKLQEVLQEKYQALENNLRQSRLQHIKSMEKSLEKQNYKLQIPTVRKVIEEKQAEIDPIKSILQELQNSRKNILKKCLSIGYDVRQEGLTWIVKELNGQVQKEHFPKFLNLREVNFIMDKYQTQLQQNMAKSKQNLLSTIPERSSDEILDMLARKRNRQFTMVHQPSLLKQLQDTQRKNFESQRHHLISNQVLVMAQQLPLTKATSYQIIYKQTRKKLNKFCTDHIHNRLKTKRVSEPRLSILSLKLLNIFDSKLENSLKQSQVKKSNQLQTELDEIIRNLRYDCYRTGQKGNRNPVSIIACLVGWKKTKKIFDSQMNMIV